MLTPERELWLAVLEQALEDYVSPIFEDHRLAKRWLFLDAEERHFRRVCLWAGQDPALVRREAYARAAGTWAWADPVV